MNQNGILQTHLLNLMSSLMYILPVCHVSILCGLLFETLRPRPDYSTVQCVKPSLVKLTVRRNNWSEETSQLMSSLNSSTMNARTWSVFCFILLKHHFFSPCFTDCRMFSVICTYGPKIPFFKKPNPSTPVSHRLISRTPS